MGRSPGRGDIVVCFAPDDGTRLVKRVVGQPGDTPRAAPTTSSYVNGIAQSYSTLAADTRGVRDLESRGAQAPPFSPREQLVSSGPDAGSHAHAVMALPGRPALRSFRPDPRARGRTIS